MEEITQQEKLFSYVEALIFVSEEPITKAKIIETIRGTYSDEELLASTRLEETVSKVLEELTSFYTSRKGGFELKRFDHEGYRFQVSMPAEIVVEKLFEKNTRPLSRAAQETMAIIAYRQPATRADVEFIRGVDSGSIIKNLLDKKLIKCIGRKEEAGRPLLFVTTEEFLDIYGLNSLKDLPPIEAFQPQTDQIKSGLERLDEKSEETKTGESSPREIVI